MKMLELYEQMVREEKESDQLYEMARVGEKHHGIKGLVIWVGEANKRHGLRIKVSNIRGKWSNNNNFIVMMPSLDYDPKKVAKWIDMNEVISWIKLNQGVLYAYELGEIQLTDEFLNRISSI